MRIKYQFMSAVAALALVLSGTASALAHDGTSGQSGKGRSGSATVTQQTSNSTESEPENGTETETESGTEANHGGKVIAKTAVTNTGQTKSVEARQRACKNRQQAINKIMQHIIDHSTKQIGVFDTIATRTEAFYVKKGNTISNYDQLVKAVNDAKSKAQSDLEAMQINGAVDCTSPDPKVVVNAFQANLKQEQADLKAYKTAIKNLIVGVKTAQKNADTKSTSTEGETQQ